jgi:hypothetical protein
MATKPGNVQVEIPEAVRRRVKALAAREGTTMEQEIVLAIGAHCSAREAALDGGGTPRAASRT